MNMKIIYVDMDSVLVDFQSGIDALTSDEVIAFKNNLDDGISYYQQLFSDSINSFEVSNDNLLLELEQLREELFGIKIPILQAV